MLHLQDNNIQRNDLCRWNATQSIVPAVQAFGASQAAAQAAVTRYPLVGIISGDCPQRLLDRVQATL